MEVSLKDPIALQQIRRRFPKLAVEGFEVTSVPDRRYNCISWAVGEKERWSWPADCFYWPTGVERNASLSAFAAFFARCGYIPCDSRDPEVECEKVALYVGRDYLVLHAARQLQDGRWTSKLGSSFDIAHSLTGLEGPEYGFVAQILKRPVRSVRERRAFCP